MYTETYLNLIGTSERNDLSDTLTFLKREVLLRRRLFQIPPSSVHLFQLKKIQTFTTKRAQKHQKKLRLGFL